MNFYRSISRIVTKKAIFSVLALILLLPLIVNAASFNLENIPKDFYFNRTLKRGDSFSPEVSYLQFILNQDVATKVAETGAGSLTGLTNFFGLKTHSAVMRFQEKYRDEILTPIQVKNPTGIVGKNTRKKLNQILGNLFSNTLQGANNTSTPTKNSLSDVKTSQPKLFTPSALGLNSLPVNNNQTGKQPTINRFSNSGVLDGQIISLFGSEFHPTNNTIYLGSEKIGVYPAQDNGSRITFSIPKSLETGSYEVAVVSSNGIATTGTTYLNIEGISPTSSTSQSSVPNLKEIYPKNSKNLNDLIFIQGENFSVNNTLETNLGNTTAVSVDGRTLTFMISELPYYMEAFEKYRGQSINVIIKVRNKDGLSLGQFVHVIDFPNSSIPTINTSPQTAPATFSNATVTSSSSDSIYQKSIDRLNANLSLFSSSSSTTSKSTSTSSSGGSSNTSTNNNQSAAAGASSAAGAAIAASAYSGGSSGSSAGMITHFGGRITQVTYCTCSGTILLGIQDISSKQNLQVFFRYGQSTLKENYNIFTTGVNVLGGLLPGGGDCEVYSGNSCSTSGYAQYTIDTVRGVGTAATPS